MIDPRLDPASRYMRVPLAPHLMRRRFTPTRDVIVLCHLGVPHLDRGEWSVAIDGLVARPAELRFADLLAYPKVTIATGSPVLRQSAEAPRAHPTGVER